MCYARRQRSSWARIKLSKKLYIIQTKAWLTSTLIEWSCSNYYLRAFVNSKEFSESFLVHCCSIFNERSLLAAALVGSLYIISHPLAFVKRFFESFLKTFLFALCRGLSLQLVLSGSLLLWSPPFCRRLVYYITSVSVCQEVLRKFFKNFFQPLAGTGCNAVSLTAPLLYHFNPSLSIPFANLFQLFSIFFSESFFSSVYIELSLILYYNKTVFFIPESLKKHQTWGVI